MFSFQEKASGFPFLIVYGNNYCSTNSKFLDIAGVFGTH
jgi:hypothetical protein